MDTGKPKAIHAPQVLFLYFYTFFVVVVAQTFLPLWGTVCTSPKAHMTGIVSHVCWDSQTAALQEVIAKVQRKPTQEHHSNGNCAVEAGMAELPRQRWGGTMAGCRQLCRQLGTGEWDGGA